MKGYKVSIWTEAYGWNEVLIITSQDSLDKVRDAALEAVPDGSKVGVIVPEKYVGVTDELEINFTHNEEEEENADTNDNT